MKQTTNDGILSGVRAIAINGPTGGCLQTRDTIVSAGLPGGLYPSNLYCDLMDGSLAKNIIKY